MAHVAEWKKEEVNELKGLIESAEVVGIVNLLNIPARQLQEMRKTLAGKATIRLSKINLMKLALEDCVNEKANITELSDYMEGQPALVCTDMNPFRLYKILEDSKTSAPAKAGAIAPEDIVVPAGDTGFPPGPFLGDLQQIGVNAKIDKGKIVVQKDTVVVEAGEAVPRAVAAALTRLDIKPMEVGMDLKAVYEEGSIFKADVLAIDEEETFADIQNAFTRAFNLSVFSAFPTSETISTIISTAHSKAYNVAIEAAIPTGKTSDMLIALANAKMLALAGELASDAIDDEIANKLANVAVAAAPAVEEAEEEVEEEEEEEEDKSEETAALGLGALFG